METGLSWLIFLHGWFTVGTTLIAPKLTDCYSEIKYRTLKYSIAFVGLFFICLSMLRLMKISFVESKIFPVFCSLLLLLNIILIVVNLDCFPSVMIAETVTVFGLSLFGLFFIFKSN